mmetsp:Transcript_29491/g.30615  ORF Transcript_29491/g.30615 Transcript_29491/m.30615 type:complete len:155 (+) Transcript_29491:1-465(+)
MGEGYSFSVDYWSLGVCLYEFVCGSFPFINEDEVLDDPLVIYEKIIENELSFPKFVKDENLKDIICKLICKKPGERLSNLNSVFNHPWFEEFEFDKIIEMKQPAPYIPKLKLNIRLKTTSYEEFLKKNLENFNYIPIDEEKNNSDNDSVWLESF